MNFFKDERNIPVLYTYHSFSVSIFLCQTFETYFLKRCRILPDRILIVLKY